MNTPRSGVTLCIVATITGLIITTNVAAKKIEQIHAMPKYKLPKIPLIDAQELKKLSDKQQGIGPVGTIAFTATKQETVDMVCTLEKPKECYGGYPIEHARAAGWSFSPNNTFEQHELVLVPYEQTKYVVGVILKKEDSKDATHAVQISINTVVYIPTHNLGKKAQKETKKEDKTAKK